MKPQPPDCPISELSSSYRFPMLAKRGREAGAKAGPVEPATQAATVVPQASVVESAEASVAASSSEVS